MLKPREIVIPSGDNGAPAAPIAPVAASGLPTTPIDGWSFELGAARKTLLAQRLATILPDLSTCQDREALIAAYRRTYPSVRGARLVRDVSQLYAFAHEMRRGDLVALPLYLDLPVAVGEIVGDYECSAPPSPQPHTRPVRWLATEQPRLQLLRCYLAEAIRCRIVQPS